MATDVLPETPSQQRPSRPQPGGDHANSPRSRWWGLGLLAIVAVVVASAATLIPTARQSLDNGPRLTHTVTRGELIVTVTEQGTLESSDNLEIKCKVRGQSTVIWVIEGGTEVEPGDELVRLDTLALEDAISERTKYAHLTRSGAERARADEAVAEIAISEYLEGRYRSQLMLLEKDLAIAETGLRTAQNMRDYANKMAERGYVSDLVIEEREFAVKQAELHRDVTITQIKVLKKYTKRMQLETLNGNLNAARAKRDAEEERAKMDAARRDQAKEELADCVVTAERSGMVIYPSAEAWKNTPEIEEGATVHKDQVLLLMPDLSKMQVKVGIHESIIERITPGLAAKVTLPDKTLHGEVASVSAVTRPAGWWTGNVVKYDTIIRLPSVEGLRPGMSAEVEVVMARHENVLKIPVSAVVETIGGDFCWVETGVGAARRPLELGDTNDEFIVVLAGLEQGEDVVLDPLATVEEAQDVVLKPQYETSRQQ